MLMVFMARGWAGAPSAWRGLIGAALILVAACSSKPGYVGLTGTFKGPYPPPDEIRIMLDPRSSGARGEKITEALAKPNLFVSTFPDETGTFESARYEVALRRGEKKPRPPTFFISFANERGTLYAAGPLGGIFQYRTFDAATKAETPRADACWQFGRAGFTNPEKRMVRLVLTITPNRDSSRTCGFDMIRNLLESAAE